MSTIVIPFIIAIFLAINMGGSGIGPSFSTAFGADIIKKSTIAGLFGIMVFLGAIISGGETAKTIGTGIISPDLMSVTQVSIIFFAVSISLLIANLAGIPQSTSQSAVLAVVAPGLLLDNFSTNRLFTEIIPMWLVLPIIAFSLCFATTKYIIKPIKSRNLKFTIWLNRPKFLKFAIIAVSMYVAYSIGSNNVANASGPLAVMSMNKLGVETGSEQSSLVIAICTMIAAPCFGIGASIFGDKILRNTGKSLFLFSKNEALLISFVSASLLLMASLVRGIPTSLVQLNVGAILGVGIANVGAKSIISRTEVKRFFYMWLISPIIAFTISLTLTYLLVL